MQASVAPGEAIVLSSLPNLRDVGGWPTQSAGTVKRGLLYRSTALDNLTPDDMGALSDLGIRTIFDLRTKGECTDHPDRAPTSSTYLNLDVYADKSDAAAAHNFDLIDDPDQAEKALGDGQAVEEFIEAYVDIIRLSSANKAYREMFLACADPGQLPGLLHCTTGKDRTGWGTAALLLLLGVSEEDVMREYLLSNDQLEPALQPVFDHFEAAGGDPELLIPILKVRAEYLQASLDEMRATYGTIEGYFTNGLGLGADVQSALREIFTPNP